MRTLRVSLLGGFRAVRDGVPIENFRSQKTQSLLAYLLIHRQQAYPRAILADRFWDKSDDSQTSSNLRSALYSLRQALEGPKSRFGKYLLVEGDSVRFNVQSPYWLDVEEFEKKLSSAQNTSGKERATLLREAVSLYQGELLAGFYDEWIRDEQKHFKDMYVRALSDLVSYYRERDEYESAITWAQRALKANTFHEEMHQELIRLYALSGDRDAALKQYAECEAMLRQELNSQPSSETRTLYEKILQGDISRLAREASLPSTTPALQNLPRPSSSFIGRKKEMAEIKRLIVNLGKKQASTLLTLTGTGGCGKTRLALQVATALAKEYADGIWWVEFAALTDPQLIPQTVAAVLSLREERNQPLLATLTNYLKSKKLLLVLDNCEHLLKASAQLAEILLGACPNLRILATSREPFDILRETVWKTPPLLLPDLSTLSSQRKDLVSSIAPYEAIELFVERATFSYPGFELTLQNVKAVAEICYKLDGLPLAIELAAARVKALSIDEIEARLNNTLGPLAQGSRAALPKDQTLRAMMDWSYGLLSEKEQTLLRRLSIFAGGFILWAVEGVCTHDKFEEFEVQDLLTQLVNKSLVNVSNREGKVRYGLLETVRQYCHEKLEESGELQSVRGRHLDFFLKLAERAEPELHGSKQAEWLTHLEREHDNLSAALTWGLQAEGAADALFLLAGALVWFWIVRGFFGEGQDWLEGCLRKAGGGARHRAKILNGLGILAYLQADYTRSVTQQEGALATFSEIGDKQGIGDSLLGLGNVAAAQGDYALANKRYEEALTIFREIHDKRGIADSLHGLGNVATAQANYAVGKERYEEALIILHEIGDKRGIADSLLGLGNVAIAQGNYTLARERYEEALTILREIGDKRGIGFSLNDLGGVANAQGNYALANEWYGEALTIFREISDKRLIGVSLSRLGEVATAQGNFVLGKEQYEEALTIFREIDDKRFIGNSLHGLGNVAFAQGDYELARVRYVEACAIRREIGTKLGLAISIEALAKLAHAQRQVEQALRLFATAATLCEEIGYVLNARERKEHEQALTALRTAVGEEAYEKGWAEGRAMTIEYALEKTVDTRKED